MKAEGTYSVKGCRFTIARGNVASVPNSGVAWRSVRDAIIVFPGHGGSPCNGQARGTEGYVYHSDGVWCSSIGRAASVGICRITSASPQSQSGNDGGCERKPNELLVHN